MRDHTLASSPVFFSTAFFTGFLAFGLLLLGAASASPSSSGSDISESDATDAPLLSAAAAAVAAFGLAFRRRFGLLPAAGAAAAAEHDKRTCVCAQPLCILTARTRTIQCSVSAGMTRVQTICCGLVTCCFSICCRWLCRCWLRLYSAICRLRHRALFHWPTHIQMCKAGHADWAACHM